MTNYDLLMTYIYVRQGAKIILLHSNRRSKLFYWPIRTQGFLSCTNTERVNISAAYEDVITKFIIIHERLKDVNRTAGMHTT
jgi:hypothetical protein